MLIDTSINTLDTIYEVKDEDISKIHNQNLFPIDEISFIDKINGKTVKYKEIMADKSRVSKEFIDNIVPKTADAADKYPTAETRRSARIANKAHK